MVPDKLILQRKTRSTLNISGSDGKNKSVQVEVRKTRTFIRHKSQEYEQKQYITQKVNSEKEFKIRQENIKEEKFNTIIKEDTAIINNSVDNINKDNFLKKNDYEKKDDKYQLNQHKIKGENYLASGKKNKIDGRILNEPQLVSVHQDNILDCNNFKVQNNNSYNNIKCYGDKHRVRTSSTNKKSNKLLTSKINREEILSIHSNKPTKRKYSSISQHIFQKPTKTINRDVIIGEKITVSELANKMAIKSSKLIRVMMQLGMSVTINQTIDQETAQLIAEDMGHRVILRKENELEEAIMNDRCNDIITTKLRAPIVTIMGHVDHGKTSLLDYIRSTKVAINESGGITQRINAYYVNTKNGTITFIDTPGHFAFHAMRARGIQITDIIVLVVAADDGVMPQTIEAIQHAKNSKIPIIVAINKIDKNEADIDRVKNELAQYNIIPEEWGGDCQFVYISAKLGTGVNELLDAISLQAEILELKAIYTGMARCLVLESYLDRGCGPIANVLIREGTLHKGDIILCGVEYGKIRVIRNEFGHELLTAYPSTPVEILGLSGVPAVGDIAIVVRDEKKARELASQRQDKLREVKLSQIYQKKYKLDNIFSNVKTKKNQELNIILKADAYGSIEAISSSLLELSSDHIRIKIVGSGVGNITETDAVLAESSNAILIAFNVSVDASARRVIYAENLDIFYYSVIYHLIDEIKIRIDQIISSKIEPQILGTAKVQNVFKSCKLSVIAGCIITDGLVKRHNSARVLRNNKIVYEGKIESLRRFKNDVNEVNSGMECGIGIKNYNDIHIGDKIEFLEFIDI